MSTTTVICPSCSRALRSRQPLPAEIAVRCPDCGHRFQTPALDPYTDQGFPALPPPLPDLRHPEDSPRSNLPLVVALCGLCFVIGGGIAVTVWLNTRERPAPATPSSVAENDQDRQKHLAEEKRLQEREKDLQEKEKKLEQDTRKVKFSRLLAEGRAALLRQEFGQAEQKFFEALKLYPEDAEAINGLTLALQKGAVETAVKDRTAKDQAEYNRLMTLGQDKMKAKEYAAALTAFQGALALMTGDAAALAGRDEAQKALDSDKAQQETLKKYNVHMEAGRLAMLDKRYEDAVREFLAATQAIPGDALAARSLRDAEKRIDDLKTADQKRQAFQQELELARTALNNNRPVEALAALDRALKMKPNDPTALALVKQARNLQAAVGQARADFNQILANAQAALLTRRFAQAATLYQQADRMFPGDPDVRRGLQQLQTLQAAQFDYVRFMAQGNAALQQKLYPQALQAFADALRTFPGDADAQTGFNQAQAALNQMGNYAQLVNDANQAIFTRQWKLAIAKLLQALQFTPNDVLLNSKLLDARYNAAMADGQAAFQSRQWQTAINCFQMALNQRPGDIAASTQLQQAQNFLNAVAPKSVFPKKK